MKREAKERYSLQIPTGKEGGLIPREGQRDGRKTDGTAEIPGLERCLGSTTEERTFLLESELGTEIIRKFFDERERFNLFWKKNTERGKSPASESRLPVILLEDWGKRQR